MKSLSKNILSLSKSATIEFAKKASLLKQKGHDVINLSTGEPHFTTPKKINEAGQNAIKNNITKYTMSDGTVELKKLIAQKLFNENSIKYSPDQITVCNGAKHALYNSLAAIINPKDEILIPSPYWVSYPELVKSFGAKPVFVEGQKSRAYKINTKSLKACITDNTKALIINSPCNPTGAVYTLKELKEIAEIALKNDIFIISDEVYEKYIFDNKKHYSIASLNKDVFNKTITINGFSKSHAMTGWRIGYVSAPKEISNLIKKIQAHSTNHPSTISMKAATEALKMSPAFYHKNIEKFEKRRNVFFNGLLSLKGFKLVKPQGAFYLFPDISYYIKNKNTKITFNDSMDFCNFLLNKLFISAVPGIAFGQQNCIRFSFSTDIKNIRKTIRRLKQGVNEL